MDLMIQMPLRQQKKESPTAWPSGFLGKKPGSVLLSHGNPHTIIGAEQFHFRVREGIGWFPLAMAARQFGREAALRHTSQIKNSGSLSVVSRRYVAGHSTTPGCLGVIWSSRTAN